MSRINLRNSSGTLGLPRAVWISNARMIEIQPDANELRSQAGRWPAHPKHRERGDTTQRTTFSPKRRNKPPRGIAPQHIDLLPKNQDFRFKRTLELNKLVSAVHSSMRTSTIGHEHHPIRRARQPYRVSDKDRATHAEQQVLRRRSQAGDWGADYDRGYRDTLNEVIGEASPPPRCPLSQLGQRKAPLEAGLVG
jgi:hypothetical protein